VTSFAYDAAGNQISMIDANGRTINYDYDQLNRRTKVRYPDGTFTSTTYNNIGRVIAKVDQAGKVTQFEYDRLGELVKVTDALGQVTSFTYNEAGQQISETDALNQTTRYESDPIGRRTKRLLPLGASEAFTYDAQGNFKSHTDFNGKTTTYAHNAMNQLISRTPDPSLNQSAVLFTYNVSGKRATMSDASGMTIYNYDLRNRLSTKQTPFGALSYNYDETGNLREVRSSNSNGVSVDYSYDTLNRLSSVKDNNIAVLNGGVTNYTYDTVGNMQSYQYPNGITTSYAYNALNRLTTMTAGTPISSLATYSYTLGPSGNRTSVVELGGRSVNYTYDDLYRLTSESITNDPHGANGAISYGYDAVGNRLSRTSSLSQVPSQTSSYDANNRLISEGYDNNGNTTAAGGNTYAYDFENHLTSQNGGNVSYVYDGDGNRVSKTAGGVTTKYLVDSNNPTGYPQVVEEIQSNSVVKSYTYGHSLISQRIVAGSLSFYQYDGHGSVRLLTNAGGAITNTYDYDAFGNLINRSGTTPNDYLFSGEQFDANIGFYYLRARYMNPAAGRFLSMDSFEGDLADPITLHKYLYADADPVDRVDPSGRFGTYVDLAGTADLNLSVLGVQLLKVLLVAGAAIEGYRYLFERRWRMWTAGRLTHNFHTCILAKDSQRGLDWTYDVGLLSPGHYPDSKESPFTFFEGFLEKTPALGDTAQLIPVGRMMDWQLELWEFIMMGGTAGADQPFETPYAYAFAFRNCTTWTAGAAATARIVSLIPS
jgi:RHS repeat-associated protein